jgi:two-component system, NtrC family, sensor kinase
MEQELHELISLVDMPGLLDALSGLAGGRAGLLAADGSLLAGDAGAHRHPVQLDGATIAFLGCDQADVARGAAMARLIEQQLDAARRVQLVSDLQQRAIENDYRELQARTAELLASEERYRRLNRDLERRVEEQVHALRDTERRLSEARRLASMGHLAAGIAHEINTPLGFVGANLRSGRKYAESLATFADTLAGADGIDSVREAWKQADLAFAADDLPALLEESQEGVGRIAAIVTALKGLTGAADVDRQWVSLPRLVARAIDAARQGSNAVARVRDAVGKELELRVRAQLLEQALGEVLRNAMQAAGLKGELAIETRQLEGGDGPVLELDVSDDGPGMDEATLEHAFDPFFTTRPVGSGVGLGLTVAREIVLAHGGEISIESEPSQGCRVTIRLPVDIRRGAA